MDKENKKEKDKKTICIKEDDKQLNPIVCTQKSDIEEEVPEDVIKINWNQYISITKPNFWKKWEKGEDDKLVKGMIIGYNNEKIKVWSTLFILQMDEFNNPYWIPLKNAMSYCSPIRGEDAKTLYFKYITL